MFSDLDWFERGVFAVLGLIVTGIIVLVGWVIWYEVNDPGQGTITGKEYNRAWVSCTGKPIICTSHPECYRIKYTDGKHDGDACVDPQSYAEYQVGQHYPREQ